MKSILAALLALGLLSCPLWAAPLDDKIAALKTAMKAEQAAAKAAASPVNSEQSQLLRMAPEAMLAGLSESLAHPENSNSEMPLPRFSPSIRRTRCRRRPWISRSKSGPSAKSPRTPTLPRLRKS